jgi:hypothetical protein
VCVCACAVGHRILRLLSDDDSDAGPRAPSEGQRISFSAHHRHAPDMLCQPNLKACDSTPIPSHPSPYPHLAITAILDKHH